MNNEAETRSIIVASEAAHQIERLGSLFPSWHRSWKCNYLAPWRNLEWKWRKREKTSTRLLKTCLSVCLTDYKKRAQCLRHDSCLAAGAIKCVEELSKYWNHRASRSQWYVSRRPPSALCLFLSPNKGEIGNKCLLVGL
jgi:hypothetical protein